MTDEARASGEQATATTTEARTETPKDDPLAGLTPAELHALRERAKKEEEQRKQARRRSRNPYLPKEGMARVVSTYFLWTSEAILASRFERDGETFFRPVDGLLVGAEVRYGAICFCLILYAPAVVADDSGRIVEAAAGKRLVGRLPMQLAGSFDTLWPRSEIHPKGLPGCPHVTIEPTLPTADATKPFVTYPDGSVELSAEIQVELDRTHPSGVKLVSLESALGVAADGGPPAREQNGQNGRGGHAQPEGRR